MTKSARMPEPRSRLYPLGQLSRLALLHALSLGRSVSEVPLQLSADAPVQTGRGGAPQTRTQDRGPRGRAGSERLGRTGSGRGDGGIAGKRGRDCHLAAARGRLSARPCASLIAANIDGSVPGDRDRGPLPFNVCGPRALHSPATRFRDWRDLLQAARDKFCAGPSDVQKRTVAVFARCFDLPRPGGQLRAVAYLS